MVFAYIVFFSVLFNKQHIACTIHLYIYIVYYMFILYISVWWPKHRYSISICLLHISFYSYYLCLYNSINTDDSFHTQCIYHIIYFYLPTHPHGKSCPAYFYFYFAYFLCTIVIYSHVTFWIFLVVFLHSISFSYLYFCDSYFSGLSPLYFNFQLPIFVTFILAVFLHSISYTILSHIVSLYVSLFVSWPQGIDSLFQEIDQLSKITISFSLHLLHSQANLLSDFHAYNCIQLSMVYYSYDLFVLWIVLYLI